MGRDKARTENTEILQVGHRCLSVAINASHYIRLRFGNMHVNIKVKFASDFAQSTQEFVRAVMRDGRTERKLYPVTRDCPRLCDTTAGINGFLGGSISYRRDFALEVGGQS